MMKFIRQYKQYELYDNPPDEGISLYNVAICYRGEIIESVPSVEDAINDIDIDGDWFAGRAARIDEQKYLDK
jgi:hypothetical protein